MAFVVSQAVGLDRTRPQATTSSFTLVPRLRSQHRSTASSTPQRPSSVSSSTTRIPTEHAEFSDTPYVQTSWAGFQVIVLLLWETQGTVRGEACSSPVSASMDGQSYRFRARRGSSVMLSQCWRRQSEMTRLEFVGVDWKSALGDARLCCLELASRIRVPDDLRQRDQTPLMNELKVVALGILASCLVELDAVLGGLRSGRRNGPLPHRKQVCT